MSTQALALPFVWTTQTGEKYPVTEMRTAHIFYALRMIWNHTAPESMQLPGGRYDGPERWPASYRRRAVIAFIRELANRPATDLSAWQWMQIGIMADWSKQIFETAQQIKN